VKERAEPCALLHESVRLQSTSLGVLQLDLRRDPVIPIGLGFVAAGDAQSPEEDLVASIRQDVGLLFLLCNNGGIPCLSVRAVRTVAREEWVIAIRHQANQTCTPEGFVEVLAGCRVGQDGISG